MSAELAQYRRTFDEQGYVVVPDLLAPDELAELRRRVDAVMDGTVKPHSPNTRGDMEDFDIQWEPATRDDPRVKRRDKLRVVFHLCHTLPYFMEHATRPRTLGVVSALLGSGVKLYTDQLFFKPAHHGSEVPFHQDSSYWPDWEPRLLTCWVAIDEATIANGCVRVIPGSHKKQLPHHHFPDSTQSEGLLESEVEVEREVPVELAAGSAMFHHSLLIHRSFPNTSDRSRRGLATIYLPADLKVRRNSFKWGFQAIR